MIEINLLPGDGKKKKRAKTSSGVKFEIHPSQWFAGISEKITDKYMLGAVGAAAICGALIVLMFISQTARAAMLDAHETKAVKDSAQYSAVLNAKAKAEATRDSLYQQIAIIKSIDDSRYLWSHLMYEISNALPQYTWLMEITQTVLGAGALGLVYGRNVIQHDDPAAMTRALAALVHEGASADAALASLG